MRAVKEPPIQFGAQRSPQSAKDRYFTLHVRVTPQQMECLESLARTGLYGDGTADDVAREILASALRKEHIR